MVTKKKQYISGNCLKRGGGRRQFADLREGFVQKRGQCTLCRLLETSRLNIYIYIYIYIYIIQEATNKTFFIK